MTNLNLYTLIISSNAKAADFTSCLYILRLRTLTRTTQNILGIYIYKYIHIYLYNYMCIHNAYIYIYYNLYYT